MPIACVKQCHSICVVTGLSSLPSRLIKDVIIHDSRVTDLKGQGGG